MIKARRHPDPCLLASNTIIFLFQVHKSLTFLRSIRKAPGTITVAEEGALFITTCWRKRGRNCIDFLLGRSISKTCRTIAVAEKGALLLACCGRKTGCCSTTLFFLTRRGRTRQLNAANTPTRERQRLGSWNSGHMRILLV